MKKKEKEEPKGPITNIDVAKVLGMDKEYEDGLLEGEMKQLYEEYLKEDEEEA